MHRMIPIRGVLQEARVTQEVATPVYIDSSSTTFVATNRAAPKKSTWVRRKSEELNECHELGESNPIKIDECDNFADPQTKYLTTVRCGCGTCTTRTTSQVSRHQWPPRSRRRPS